MTLHLVAREFWDHVGYAAFLAAIAVCIAHIHKYGQILVGQVGRQTCQQRAEKVVRPPTRQEKAPVVPLVVYTGPELVKEDPAAAA